MVVLGQEFLLLEYKLKIYYKNYKIYYKNLLLKNLLKIYYKNAVKN